MKIPPSQHWRVFTRQATAAAHGKPVFSHNNSDRCVREGKTHGGTGGKENGRNYFKSSVLRPQPICRRVGGKKECEDGTLIPDQRFSFLFLFIYFFPFPWLPDRFIILRD